MALYTLILLMGLLTIYSYLRFNRDIIHPSFVLCATYFISVICTLFNVDRWNVDFHWVSVAVIYIGAVIFIGLGSLIDNIFAERYQTLKTKLNFDNVLNFRIPIWISIIVSFYGLIVIIILRQNVKIIASNFGEYHNYSEALTIFRTNTSYIINAKLPSYVTLIMKPVIAFAYLSGFSLTINIVKIKNLSDLKDKVKNGSIISDSAPILMYMYLRISESNRGSIITLLITIATYYFLIRNITTSFNKPIRFQSILVIGGVLIGILGLFYAAAPLIGRENDNNFFQYISLYLGGSPELLNRFLISPKEPSIILGQETFYHTLRDLYTFGILKTDVSLLSSAHLPFLFNGEVLIGNVYTAYRRWISDFGYFGAIFLQLVLSAIFHIMYYKFKYLRINENYFEICLILYGYSFYSILMHFIDSYFYLEMFTRSTFLTLSVMIISYLLIKNQKRLISIFPRMIK